MPYYMLASSIAKCFHVDVPPQTTVTIAYSAPDLNVDDEPVDANQRTATRSMSIVVMQKSPSGTHRTPPHHHRERAAKAPSGRIRQQLTQREGTIEYTTGIQQGLVEICVQAIAASKRWPSRIAVRVFQDKLESSGRKLVLQKLARGQVIRSGAEQLTEQSSRLTDELKRISNHIKQIAGTAEHTKQREKALQDRSLSLQNAVKFWPIFRMFVLISAAYMQTHYVVSFMKRKHIF